MVAFIIFVTPKRRILLHVCAHVERRRSCIVGPPTWHMCHEDERFSGLTLAVFCALAARAQTSVVSRQCQAVRTPEVLLQTMKYFTLYSR